MMSLLNYIDFGKKKPKVDNYEIINSIEKGQITSSVLAKYCMPKKSFYDFYVFTVDEIVVLYRELKSKKPEELELVIIQMVLPEFKYWSSMCVTQFESIIKEKNVNIDYNHIYSLFYDLLQKNNYRYLDSHI